MPQENKKYLNMCMSGKGEAAAKSHSLQTTSFGFFFGFLQFIFIEV